MFSTSVITIIAGGRSSMSAGCRFVTRLKKNTPLTVVQENRVPKNSNILSDRIGHLPARLAKSRKNPLQVPVREIRVIIDTGKMLRIVTNDLDAPAEEIADLYKQRWQIELFFRWVKQTLRIKRFIGVSENAVRIQIAVALDRLSYPAHGPGGSKSCAQPARIRSSRARKPHAQTSNRPTARTIAAGSNKPRSVEARAILCMNRTAVGSSPAMTERISTVCDRAPARLNCRYDRRCSLRFPPSESLCPSGYDPPAALAGGARPAHGDLRRRAGAGIRRSRHCLRRHRRRVCAAQSRAADRLQPDAAAGTGLCGGAARAQHRRTRSTSVLHRRPAEPVLIPVSRPGPDLGDGAADPADDRDRPARGRLRLGAGVLPSAAAVGQRRPAGAAADLSARRLALDRARDRRHQSLCVPGHRGGAQAFRCAGGDRTGADARAASDPDRRPCRRRRA